MWHAIVDKHRNKRIRLYIKTWYNLILILVYKNKNNDILNVVHKILLTLEI